MDWRCGLSFTAPALQAQSAEFKLLCACVEGPCLHRPENWLVRQLNDEPKLVFKVGFIREKGKATVGEE
jgi:hypothetical protein